MVRKNETRCYMSLNIQEMCMKRIKQVLLGPFHTNYIPNFNPDMLYLKWLGISICKTIASFGD